MEAGEKFFSCIDNPAIGGTLGAPDKLCSCFTPGSSKGKSLDEICQVEKKIALN